MQSDNIQRLLEWGQQYGVDIPHEVRFEYDEIEGIRCICTEDIESPSLTIPVELIICKKLISSVMPGISYNDGNSNTYLKFSLARLMYDSSDNQIKNLGEKYKPYLDCLPTVVGSPLVWNPAEQRLLEGTNLGNSLRDKLYIIWTEWFTAVRDTGVFDGFDKAAIEKDLKLYENYAQASVEEIYEQIIETTVHRTPSVWYSFSAFLWAHLILLSRAFPEYVLNSNCERHQVMLLPIVDLLNHDFRSKVEWSSNGTNFSYKHLGPAEKGTQLYNNYGGKGNEELLSGYGFVLTDNPCSSVALKIKLPFETISKIITEEPEIQLLTLDDYTTFAFENGPADGTTREGKTAEHIYQEGVTYLVCKNDDRSLQNMLTLFSYLNTVGQVAWTELAPRFRGLQSLRLALDQKLQQVGINIHEKQDLGYPIDEHRYHDASVYRDEQVSILKWALSQLKSMEKRWLSEHKTRLVTTKKIIKYDSDFLDVELPTLFGSKAHEYLALLSPYQFLALWITVKLFNNSFVSKYSWVHENYKQFMLENQELNLSDPEADTFHSAILHKSDARLNINVEDTRAVFRFLAKATFTRLASRDQETMLVRTDT